MHPVSKTASDRGRRWSAHLADLRHRTHQPDIIVEGKLSRAAGLTLEATGCEAALGARCVIEGQDGSKVQAEVVGFAGDRLFLMPTSGLAGVMPDARVIPTRTVARVPVGFSLLGRVIDGAGQPLDGRGPVIAEAFIPLEGRPVNPLLRQPIVEPLDVGVRSINALFTAGRGQRLGLFAGSGIGKSSLLAMMTRFTTADVIVVGPDR